MAKSEKIDLYIAGEENGKLPDQQAKVWNPIAYVIIGVLLFIVPYLTFTVTQHPVRVDGPSMEPTYSNGDILKTIPYDKSVSISVNDIVVFYDAPIQLIKRVCGVPGDEIDINDGIVYRNGQIVDRYVEIDKGDVLTYPITLGTDEYFCIGDNYNNSRDSRSFGPVKEENISAVVDKKIY